MRIIFYLLFIASISIADTQIKSLGIPNENPQYQELIKKYFTTNLALQVNVRKVYLRHYYKYAKYNLIWFENDQINPFLTTVIDKIEKDSIITNEAKEIFNFSAIELLLEQKLNAKTLSVKDTVRLDLLITYMLDRYLDFVARGNIDWKLFEEQIEKSYEEDEIIRNWSRRRAYFNKVKFLEELLATKDISLIDVHVESNYPNNSQLKQVLQKYEALLHNGGYEKVAYTKTIRPGNQNEMVSQLRKRLLQSGDYKQEDYDQLMTIEPQYDENGTLILDRGLADNTYDEPLVNAVKNFQKNHGLEVDGLVGKDTIKHLNISVGEKIKIIKLNLERMRWITRKLGEKFLIVNIPDYTVKYYEDKELKLELPVVVGTYEHPTPIFSHNLTSVVLNPYWRVPQSIVQKEIIPKMIEDPNYLANNNIMIHEDWSHESQTFDPTLVDWSYYLPSEEQKENNEYPEIPFKFIQIPGENNPLGKMKFMFRNQYSVYLHDTSAKDLFKKRIRSFSHGCIRVQSPQTLLKTIADIDHHLHYDEALEILKDIEKKEIDLHKNIPIHIVYLTAWVDENGVLQFRDDIYGYDKIQSQVLFQKGTLLAVQK